MFGNSQRNKQILICNGTPREQYGDDTLLVHYSLLNKKISLTRQEDLLP